MRRVRARILISGLVQGVFFRQSMQTEADRLGVTGYVRNAADGRVEAIVEGGTEQVENLIEWCRTGPPAAEVEDVSVEWGSYQGEFGDFSVRR